MERGRTTPQKVVLVMWSTQEGAPPTVASEYPVLASQSVKQIGQRKRKRECESSGNVLGVQTLSPEQV